MDVNYVSLVGRVSRKPEVKTTRTGKTVTNFSIAVQRSEKMTDFVEIVAWGQLGEYCEQNLDKGMTVSVIGKLNIDKGTDGKKYPKVVAEHVGRSEFKRDDLGQPGGQTVQAVSYEEERIPF